MPLAGYGPSRYDPAMPDATLAEFSRTVDARLRADPWVQPVEGNGLTLFCRQMFFDADDCARLNAMIGADLYPSQLLETPGRDDRAFRTSSSCDLDRWHPFIAAIDARLSDLTGIPPEHGESLQGQRYQVGQLFKAHYDYFEVTAPYWQREAGHGGQRSWTAMAYLDEPEAGGATWFPHAGLRITPRAGMLVIWNNIDMAGDPNPAALHESEPVEAGVKTVVTKWYRREEWV